MSKNYKFDSTNCKIMSTILLYFKNYSYLCIRYDKTNV